MNLTVHPTDFTIGAANYFSLIRSFCELIRATIDLAYEQFQSIEYVNRLVVSPSLFTQQLLSNANQFIHRTTSQFFSLLLYAREMTSTNNLLSSFVSGAHLFFDTGDTVKSRSKRFELQTSCAISTDIWQSGAFIISGDADFIVVLEWNIPGIAYGCFSIESVIHSTMECWYDWQCMQTFTSLVSKRLSIPFVPPRILNISMTRFNATATFNQILSELMVEEWTTHVNFSSFFIQCSPRSCSYRRTMRDGLVTVIKNIVGIYGGLKRVLHILAPVIVYLVYSIYSYFSNRKNAVQGN